MRERRWIWALAVLFAFTLVSLGSIAPVIDLEGEGEDEDRSEFIAVRRAGRSFAPGVTREAQPSFDAFAVFPWAVAVLHDPRMRLSCSVVPLVSRSPMAVRGPGPLAVFLARRARGPPSLAFD